MKGARVAAYWGRRRPSVVDVEARRVLDVLSAVAKLHPELGRWVFYDHDERPTPCTAETIAVALRARERVEQAPGLGAVRGMSTVCRARGRFEDLAELRATVGIDHQGPDDAWAPNRLVLTVDAEVSSGTIRQILGELLRASDPLWAFADAGGGPLEGDAVGVPKVGWVTYLHRSYGRPRTPVAGVEVVRRGEGRIVQLVKEPPENPIELSVLVESIRRALADDGILRPHSDVVREPRDFERDEVDPAVKRAAAIGGTPAAAAAPEAAAHQMPDVVRAPDPLLSTQPARAPGAGEAALPFQPSTGGATPRRAEARPALDETRELGLTAPLPAGASPGRALPFGAVPAAVPGPALSVEQYASLCAWLEVEPQNRASILTRHHVPSEAALTTLQAEYARRFADEPALHGRWAGLVMRYREAFARFPGAVGGEPGR